MKSKRQTKGSKTALKSKRPPLVLTREQVREWLLHLYNTQPLWVYVHQRLQDLLTSRVTEVLKLRGTDFEDSHLNVVRIDAMKLGATQDKVLLSEAAAFVHKLQTVGLSKTRKVRVAYGRFVDREDRFTWSDGFLFRGRTWCTRNKRMGKNTLSAAIRRARQTFKSNTLTPAQIRRITSHTVRHSSIARMREAMLRQELAMRQARIASRNVYDRYGKFSAKQCREMLHDHFWGST